MGNRFRVKFHGESSGHSLNALLRFLDPEMGHKGLIRAKNQKYELGEKLDHRFRVKFHGESNSDSLDALN